MAINKPIMTRFGIEANYWKIIKLNIEFTDGVDKAEVGLAGYISQESSAMGEPLKVARFRWSGTQFPFRRAALIANDGNFYKIAYLKIKEPVLDEDGNNKNPFANGVDV